MASDATTRYKVGDIIEWRHHTTNTLNDLALITAVAATTLTIARGYLSSTPGTGNAHDANSYFVLKPGYYALNITKAIQDAIDSDLYPEVYAVYEAQLAHGSTGWNAVTAIQSIAAEAKEVLAAYQKSDSTPLTLQSVKVTHPYAVDSTTSSTKKAIRLVELADNDNTIFVQYARKAAVADLSVGACRAVEAGALARLLEWKSAFQISKEGRIVQDGVHVPGIILRTANYWRNEQKRLIEQEQAILVRDFPRRRKQKYRPHLAFSPR